MYNNLERNPFDYSEKKTNIFPLIAGIIFFIFFCVAIFFIFKYIKEHKGNYSVSNNKKLERVDTDGDGLWDYQENMYGTDINQSDTDGDGYSDYDEVKGGYNPLGEGKLSPEQEKLKNELNQPISIDNDKGETIFYNHNRGYQLKIPSRWQYYSDDGESLTFVVLENGKRIINFEISKAPTDLVPKNIENFIRYGGDVVKTKKIRVAGVTAHKYYLSDGDLMYFFRVKEKLFNNTKSEYNIIAESYSTQNIEDDSFLKDIDSIIHSYRSTNKELSDRLEIYSRAKIENLSLKVCDDFKSIRNKDFCFRDLAVEMKDFSICNQVSALEDRERCFMDVNEFLPNEKICSNLTISDSCYSALANNTKKIEYCHQMSNGQDAIDRCIMGVGIALNDESFCKLKEKKGEERDYDIKKSSETCYRTIAFSKKDPSVCLQMESPTTCLLRIAQEKKDYKICDSIQTNFKWTCYRDIAYDLKNSGICALITDQKNRDSCYHSLSGSMSLNDKSLCLKISDVELRQRCLNR